MIAFYILTFIAGMAAANGVPHFVKGITAQEFQTPFGRPSAPWVNVVWGWFNFALATVLLHFAHPWGHVYRAVTLFAVGALFLGVSMSLLWARRAKK